MLSPLSSPDGTALQATGKTMSFRAKQDHFATMKNYSGDRMRQHLKLATKRMEDNERRYVGGMLQKSFPKVMDFVAGVTGLLNTYRPQEINFQALPLAVPPCGPTSAAPPLSSPHPLPPSPSRRCPPLSRPVSRCFAAGEREGGGVGGSSEHNPQYANYWAPLTRKRHIHATSGTAPAHQPLGSANAGATPAGAPAAAADRTQRPDATCEGKTG